MWAVYLLSLVQSGILVALMVFTGVALGPRCGLPPPVFADRGSRSSRSLVLAFASALIWGVLAGVILAIAPRFGPPELAALDSRISFPLASRILYGGITEEILVRWGLMTFLLWGLLRVFAKNSGRSNLVASVAIALSALVFGLGHLPATKVFVGYLDGEIVLYIVGMNWLFGCLFGWLYFKSGIEASMIAHATTHAVAVGVSSV